jgi:hypothetical protein
MRRERLSATSVLEVPYEPLGLGPTGARLEVIDYHPPSRTYLEPVDLDVAAVAMHGGISANEQNPQFHQQMVYAVAASVLNQFDRALGRTLWFSRGRRLRLYPHAFVGANAFFLPDENAVVFGYFKAGRNPGPNLPGQYVFSCLSHDIVAHEVTHAVVHRLRPYFRQRTNPQVGAFHEAMADIVAVLLHFRLEGVLELALAQAGVDLAEGSALVELGGQFGYARGDTAALRSALRQPDVAALANARTEHRRGAILLAAVFDAFRSAYRAEVAPLLALLEPLEPGVPLDERLIRTLAAAARTIADRLLLLCIRAFEYLPPTDVTFGDFLRALVTADVEIFPGDETGLRGRMIEAFRLHGIMPEGAYSLAEESLRWDPFDNSSLKGPLPINPEHVLADAARLYEDRLSGTTSERRNLANRAWFGALADWVKPNAEALGFRDAPVVIGGFHTSFRFDQDAQPRFDAIVELRQRLELPGLNGADPTPVQAGKLVVADASGQVRYVIGRQPPDQTEAGRQRADQLRSFVHDEAMVTEGGDPLLIDFGALHDG